MQNISIVPSLLLSPRLQGAQGRYAPANKGGKLLRHQLLKPTDGVEQGNCDFGNTDKPEETIRLAKLFRIGCIVEATETSTDADAQKDNEKEDFQPFLHTIFVVFVHNIMRLKGYAVALICTGVMALSS